MIVEEYWEPFINFENEHSLPKGFFETVYAENDWSFVIKIHSLLESVSSSLLQYHLKEPAIGEIVSRLEMSNSKTGRVAFLNAMNLVNDCDRKYIYALSQLRNNLVHRVENLSFTFKEWTDKMDKTQLRQNALIFSPMDSSIIQINRKSKERNEKGLKHLPIENFDLNRIYDRFKNNTKVHLWLGLHHVLVSFSEAKGYSDYLQSRKFSEFLYEFDIEE